MLLLQRLFLILALLTVSTAGAELEGTLKEVSHQSAALGKEQKMFVYTPPITAEGERFPVLYVLHGKYGDYADWVTRADAPAVAENYRMILVFPDGGTSSWYLDSPLVAGQQLETYITGELVPFIDETEPTIPGREARGIMGLSMGGHGALLLALKHPDLFGSASSLSGILKLTNHPYREDVVERLGPWETNRDRWEANSVYDQAERFADADVHVLFDAGVDDKITGAYWDGILLNEKLTKLGIPHIWRVQSGTHSWDYWKTHLPDHLNFHQALMMGAMENQETWLTKYFTRMNEFVLENERIAIDQPDRKTLALLGSSTFERFSPELLPDWRVYNRGIVSDHLGITGRGLAKRLDLSIFDIKPDVAIVNMGVNDIGDRMRDDTGQPTEYLMGRQYERIVDTIRTRIPGTRLYITTCTPTTGRYAHLNDAIASWNEWLKEFSEARALPVIDLYPSVVNSDGELDPKYTADGLHLNKEGNEKWSAVIRKAIEDPAPAAGFAVYTLEEEAVPAATE